MTKAQKVLVSLLIACGVFLISVGVTHAATTIKIDRAFTTQFKADYNNSYNLVPIKSVACWQVPGHPKYHECLFDEKQNGKADYCGTVVIKNIYKPTQQGIGAAIPAGGTTGYTCKSVIPGIQKYLNQGKFVA